MRTHFADQQAWERLKAAALRPDPNSGYVATVTFVDDPSCTAMSAEDLMAQVADDPESAMVSFIADERAQRAEGWPLLAVWVLPPDDELDAPDHAPFRVAAAQLGAVEANINLANLDWDDFGDAVDDDGVFRGFASGRTEEAPDWWNAAELHAIISQVIDPRCDTTRAEQRADVVLADVVVGVPKWSALRRWQDLDSAWIADGVNPSGKSPNQYSIRHRERVWGQDTLAMTMQYLDTDARDQVLFQVEYFRVKATPERRWNESLDEPRALTVTVSGIDDNHARCTVRQDSCPEILVVPLSRLWTVLTNRLNI